ncbi:IS3 family transposase [Pantoea sp. Al-1710]|uniref:IS3 family transposase n=1 Tax=Candidatus Pantoea communis TaxID=2608354 RepID=A0ABX0RW22_9GAMM|nr:IS3 family transposase [Pantoea communis]
MAHAIAATGRYPLIRIAEVLRVSRSNLYDRLLEKRQHRSARYSIDDDARLLPLIRKISSVRATNGNRRVTAHLNRALKEQNWRVNPKRIYRIMQANNQLLAKSGHKKPERCHTGNVVTLKPDTRWCSDCFFNTSGDVKPDQGTTAPGRCRLWLSRILFVRVCGYLRKGESLFYWMKVAQKSDRMHASPIIPCYLGMQPKSTEESGQPLRAALTTSGYNVTMYYVGRKSLLISLRERVWVTVLMIT